MDRSRSRSRDAVASGARIGRAAGIVLAALLAPGCTSIATGALAGALSEQSDLLSRDDDPELIRDAAPFGLKTMEALLDKHPRHVDLLVGLTSGFVQYAYAFVLLDAERVENDDYREAKALRERAKGLFRRAKSYGWRALEVRQEGLPARLRQSLDDASLSEDLEEDDVPLLYWTAAAISLEAQASGVEPGAVADLPLAGWLVDQAFALAPDWENGTLHDFLGSYVMATSGDVDRARDHFARALDLSGGRRAGTYVALAETVCVREQDLQCFEMNLQKALAVDVEAIPSERLVNILMKRKAARLLVEKEDLILIPEDEDPDSR